MSVLGVLLVWIAGMMLGLAVMLYSWANALDRYEESLRELRRSLMS